VAHIPGTLFFHIDGIVHRTTDVRNVSEYICKIHESEFHRFDGQVVSKKDTFHYLRSMVQKDGDIDKDLSHRIKDSWLK
jgi:hypothetical protein